MALFIPSYMDEAVQDRSKKELLMAEDVKGSLGISVYTFICFSAVKKQAYINHQVGHFNNRKYLQFTS
jgi:hypothetical protein